MRLRYAINVTIDGCVHHEAGLPPDEESMRYWTAEMARADALLFGRVTYYQRLPWNVGVARALFAGGSLEGGNAWASRRDISIQGLRYGTSLFIGADTGMGPLYLSVVSAPKGYTGLYLFLGRP